MSTLANALGGTKLNELASWVGMDVRSTSAFHFEGQPVTLFAQADPDADATKLVIRDSDGTVIDKVTVPTTTEEFVWAGVDSSGNPMASGNYTATLECYKGNELLSEKPVATYGRVVEAQAGVDAVLLTLQGGQVIPATQVTAVRTGA